MKKVYCDKCGEPAEGDRDVSFEELTGHDDNGKEVLKYHRFDLCDKHNGQLVKMLKEWLNFGGKVV